MNMPDPNSKPATIKTVLILDGDVLVRMPVVEYLRECGCRVIEAATTDESIRPWSGLQWRPFAFWAELFDRKQLFLRGPHRRKLCQDADESDNQAEEYDFFHGCPPRT
jgi:hypothetical protein